MAFKYASAVLMAFYAVFIVLAIVSIVLVCVGYKLKMWQFKTWIHTNWCVYGFFNFLGLIICLVLTISAISSMEGCSILESIINVKEFLFLYFLIEK